MEDKWEDTLSEYPATTLALNKGKYYVLLTIPKDMRGFHSDRTQLKRSTGTSDLAAAKRLQHNITSKMYTYLDSAKPDPLQNVADILSITLDELYELSESNDLEGIIFGRMHMPLSGNDLEEDLAIEKLRNEGEEAWGALADATRKTVISTKGGMRISDAAEDFLATNPYEIHKTARDAVLAIDEFKTAVGDLPLTEVTAVMVHKYAETLGKNRARNTVQKKIGYVSRLMDHAIRKGWITSNILVGLRLGTKVGKAKESYRSFSRDELNTLFGLKMPDHLRLLFSILVTTGMRLDEAALLEWEDVKTEDGYRYFDLTGKDKRVKNIGSARMVPVPDVLNLPYGDEGNTGQMFPQFKRDKDGKAQGPASKVLMKLIRSNVTDDQSKVVHSLRGNLKDLMRDADVSKEVNDFITGHAQGDVASSYGSGPSLKVRAKAINSVKHPWLEPKKKI